MRKLTIKLLLIALVPLLATGRPIQAQEEPDLSAAFGNLKKSMKKAPKADANTALDAALDAAFSPVPEPVLQSDVSLEKVDTPDAIQAAKDLAKIPVSSELDVEYFQRGASLSLLLWSGSQRAMTNVLTNIVKQLYSDNDPTNFRFIVNSSPIPSITATAEDLNQAIRDEALERYERKVKLLTEMKKPIEEKRPEIPVKDGVVIRITAGMLATVKSVDELAGQIAKVLATLNPGVYGVREDTRFTRNQKYIELINQIVEGADDNVKEEAVSRRNQVIAELSAMERLAAGGFSPWALYYYEERVFSWLADVFRTSPNHSLGRWLVNARQYDLYDWTRPLRLQLQSYYMGYLQTIERGKNMRLQETEFSMRMKSIRLRMKLFTQPFFTGLKYQAVPIAAGVGAVGFSVASYFFPEVAYWALSAFNATPTEVAATAATEVAQRGTEAVRTIGELAAQQPAGTEAPKVTKPVLDLSYFGFNFDMSGVSDAAKSIASGFFKSFPVILGLGASTIVIGILAKYRSSISDVIGAISHRMADAKDTTVPGGRALPADAEIIDSVETRRLSADKIAETVDAEIAAEKATGAKTTYATTVLGQVSTSGDRLGRIGRTLMNALKGLPSASVSFYEGSRDRAQSGRERVGQILSASATSVAYRADRGTRRSILAYKASVRRTKKMSHATAVGIHDFAVAGADYASRKAVATKDFSVRNGVRAWKALQAAAAAAPGKAQSMGQATLETGMDLSVRFGNYALDRGERSLYAAGRGLRHAGNGIAWGAHGLFITAPVATKRGSVWLAKEIYKEVQDAREKARQEREAEMRKQLDWERMLARGAARYAGYMNHERLKPAEAMAFIADMHDDFMVQKNDDAFQRWGLETYSGGNAKAKQMVIDAFVKWVQQAKAFGVTDLELLEFTDLFGRHYEQWLDSAERKDRRVIWVGTEILDLLARSKDSDIAYLMEKTKAYAAGDIPKRPHTGSDQSGTEGYLFFKDMLTHRNVQQGKVAESPRDRVRTIVEASNNLRWFAVKDLYVGHELEILKWLASPATTTSEVSVFLRSAGANLEDGGSARKAILKDHREYVAKLTPLERSKLYISIESDSQRGLPGFWIQKTASLLEASIAEQAKLWVAEAKSVRALAERISAETSRYQIQPAWFTLPLRDEVVKRMDLIHGIADVETLFAHEFFWSNKSSNRQSSPLEAPLVELLKIKREQFGDSPAWKYDPIHSEQVQTMISDRLKEIGQYPVGRDNLEKLWKTYSSRGVSTVTDDLLGQLMKTSTPAQIDALEEYAVRQGRVFDQGLRDEFAIRQIKRSKQYKDLIQIAEQIGTDRKEKIEAVVKLAQELMTDLGIRYTDFLEEVSVRINSTYDEAEMLHEAKAKHLLEKIRSSRNGVNDSRMKMFHEILPYIKGWKAQHQYDFLLYLRGSVKEPTDFIKEQFPQFGPERIRKMYQGLPIESATAIISLYLQETLLARKTVHEGYGKKLMKFLVSGAGKATEEQKYASLFLEALLYGIDQADNKPFQKQVLSALVAMKPNEANSIGETIKVVLEKFPGVGPKVGQFLVPTGYLPPEINDVLIGTQDNTLPPQRFDIYSDLSNIVGNGKDIGMILLELLGGGSLKYSSKGQDPQSKAKLAIQVFREDVQNSSDLQVRVLKHAIDYLIEHGGKELAFLEVIVDGAVNAVDRERRYHREAQKTALARKRLYKGMSDGSFTIEVPQQELVNARLLVSKFAGGGSFHKLTPEQQQAVGLKILGMEAKIMFAEGMDGLDRKATVIWYDTDRHAGNFLIEIVEINGRLHYKITPIDFGQLTFIRTDQREKVIELFALSAMLRKMGSNDWIAEKLAGFFDLKGKDLANLKSNLAEFFPLPSAEQAKRSVITAYLSIIAAVNLTLRESKDKGPRHRDFIFVEGENGKPGRFKLDYAYTDFVRASIQLNQYEAKIKIPAEAVTPRKILESRVKDVLVGHLKAVQLSTKQELGIRALNAKNWLSSIVSGQDYQPVVIEMTREELEKFSLVTQAVEQAERATAPATETKAVAVGAKPAAAPQAVPPPPARPRIRCVEAL